MHWRKRQKATESPPWSSPLSSGLRRTEWETEMTTIYTNAVLTVIAVCLAVIAFRTDFISTAHAQAGTVHVYVDGVAPYALAYAGPLAVKSQ